MTSIEALQKRTISTETTVESFLTLLAEVVSKRRITVRLNNSDDLAYIRESKDIQISAKKVGISKIHTDPKILATFKGLTYHEIGHIIFDTYRKSPPDSLAVWINILSDQQLESRFVMKYPGTADYFQLLVARFISPKKTNSYMNLYGRRVYLPSSLIATSRRVFVKEYGEAKTVKLEKIIDEYLMETDELKCEELARQMRRLFPHDTNVSNLMTHIGSDSSIFSGHKRSQTKGEEHWTKKSNDELTEKLEKKDAGDNGSENGDGQQTLEDMEGDDGDGDDGKDSTLEEGTSNGARDGKGSGGNVSKELKDMAKDALKNVTAELQNDINMIKRDEVGMRHIPDYKPAHDGVSYWGTTTIKIDEAIKTDAKPLTKELKKLMNALKGAYVGGSKSGVPDFPVIMSNQAAGTRSTRVFKTYVPSRLHNVKIAVSIIVDISGSLRSYQTEISRATATLISALQQLSHVKFDLIHFAEGANMSVSFKSSKRLTSFEQTRLGSGTRVKSAMRTAIGDFKHVSSQYKKYCFVITDQGWWDDPSEEFRALRSMGVETVFVRAGKTSRPRNPGVWTFETKQTITKNGQARDVLKEIAIALVKQNLKEVTKR